MPKGRRVFILTQDGVIQGATESAKRADEWLGLGDMYDYTALDLEDIPGAGQAPAPASEATNQSLNQLDESMRKTLDMQKELEKTHRKLFTPKSSLLNPSRKI
jgi:hypothetical protein